MPPSFVDDDDDDDDTATSDEDEAASAPGRFLARTLKRLVDGAGARSDLSWAFLIDDEKLGADLVTFLSELFSAASLAAADPVGRLILLFSTKQIRDC